MNLGKLTSMIIKTLFEVKQNLALRIYTFQLQLEREERTSLDRTGLKPNLILPHLISYLTP
jgi:hypothetical protein